MGMNRLIEPPVAREGPMTSPTPLIISLGKLKRKKARKLKKAGEPLPGKIQEAIDEAVEKLGAEAVGKTILSVVVLFEKKLKKQRPFSLF